MHHRKTTDTIGVGDPSGAVKKLCVLIILLLLSLAQVKVSYLLMTDKYGESRFGMTEQQVLEHTPWRTAWANRVLGPWAAGDLGKLTGLDFQQSHRIVFTLAVFGANILVLLVLLLVIENPADKLTTYGFYLGLQIVLYFALQHWTVYSWDVLEMFTWWLLIYAALRKNLWLTGTALALAFFNRESFPLLLLFAAGCYLIDREGEWKRPVHWLPVGMIALVLLAGQTLFVLHMRSLADYSVSPETSAILMGGNEFWLLLNLKKIARVWEWFSADMVVVVVGLVVLGMILLRSLWLTGETRARLIALVLLVYAAMNMLTSTVRESRVWMVVVPMGVYGLLEVRRSRGEEVKG